LGAVFSRALFEGVMEFVVRLSYKINDSQFRQEKSPEGVTNIARNLA